jgi:tetratricopeptide (TPR) repeat protein
MLAHHYSNAVELARAAGLDTVGLEESARHAFREAGDRAYALGAYQAARHFYAQALDTWPESEPLSPGLLIRYGRVLNSVDVGTQPEILHQAVETALAAGEPQEAAEAQTLVCEMYWLQGRRDEAFEYLEAAEALVKDEPSSYAKAYVMANVSRFWMLAGNYEHAIRVGREALAMAEELGLEEIQASALNNIGVARLDQADPGGVDDLERSIEIADSINSMESARSYGNLASSIKELGEIDRAYALLDEARQRAEKFGLDDWLIWLRAEAVWPHYFAGRWDAALRALDELIEEFKTHRFWIEMPARSLRARIRRATGDTEGAERDAKQGLELARAGKDPQVLWPSLAVNALTLAGRDPDQAAGLIDELLSDWEGRGWPISALSEWSPSGAVVVVSTGRGERFLDGAERLVDRSPWLRAAVAYVAGDPSSAADVYRELGALPEEARARLRAAELLVREGRRAEADVELERALAFWRTAGATAYIREGEALLAASA